MLSIEQVERVKNYIAKLKPSLGGKIFFKYFGFRKQIVLQNMRLVFGNVLSEQEILKLALSFYSHMLTSIKENIKLRFMNNEQIKKRAIVIGEEYLLNLIDSPVKGVLVITGHFGNWEFAPIAGVLNFKEWTHHFYFVRKMQSIKFLEKLLFKRYYDAGLGVIPKNKSLNRMYEALEQHQVVVMVMDQHAKGKEGIMVDFFGHKTGTIRSVAMIAQHSGVPVVPARSYRREDGIHILEFFPPLDWQSHDDPKEEVLLNTRLYNQTLENLVLEYPDQWLWMYKRWKEVYKKD